MLSLALVLPRLDSRFISLFANVRFNAFGLFGGIVAVVLFVEVKVARLAAACAAACRLAAAEEERPLPLRVFTTTIFSTQYSGITAT